jgi:SAM-dependent methyltransferase
MSYQRDGLVDVWERENAAYVGKPAVLSGFSANFKLIDGILGGVGGKSVIEVGCGTGLTSLELAKHGALTSLLDFSRTSVENAVAAYKAEGLSPVSCFVEDAMHNTVPDGAYDFAFNMGVIEHFYDDGKRRMMLEMCRMVKPGGVVMIQAPNKLCVPFVAAESYLKLTGRWGDFFQDDLTAGRLLRLARSVGLSGEAYAYDVVGVWDWVPGVRDLVRWVGYDTMDRRMRRNPFGSAVVLVVRKN